VEPGETLLDALARELAEEGNVTLRGASLLHGVFHNATASRRDHVAMFIVREFEWGGPSAPGVEIREAAFFPLDALPPETSDATRRRLEEILHGAPVSATW
jgi:ADP-ribose pyrophosphatase YjhB (NUDIX family)